MSATPGSALKSFCEKRGSFLLRRTFLAYVGPGRYCTAGIQLLPRVPPHGREVDSRAKQKSFSQAEGMKRNRFLLALLAAFESVQQAELSR